MAGQLWTNNDEGGFMHALELSTWLRFTLQPISRFRQLCEYDDQYDLGLHAGDTVRWNVYGEITEIQDTISETDPTPESGFTISQKSMTITEWIQGVPYTGKLEALAEHDVKAVIEKTLLQVAQKFFDFKAHAQFNTALLNVTPLSGTSTVDLALVTDATPTVTNNVALGTGHIGTLVDEMAERNIPPVMGDHYVSVARHKTYRNLKNDLETLHQHTDGGMQHVYSGEIGSYEGMKFIRQTFVVKGGAEDSTTYNVRTKTADAWDNAKSDWMFSMGADACKEVVAIPEEIRLKIPTDYGRSKGMACYYLGGFGKTHDAAVDERIVKWDSAA